MLCPFSRILVVGFPLHTMTCLGMIMMTVMSYIVWSGFEYNNDDDVDDDDDDEDDDDDKTVG